jgi:hypothetical protein
MRIPVNSCAGCNQNSPITVKGMHFLGNGEVMRCRFVDAELQDTHLKLISVRTSRKAAARIAMQSDAGLLWCGQSPHEMWLVVRPGSQI